jgi:hypothetical protein
MMHLDSNEDILMEFVYENEQLRVIRYRQSINSRFEEMKFCTQDSDGYFYDYTIFDMVNMA